MVKQNNFKNILPIHCYTLLVIEYFQKPPIIFEIAKKLYKSKAAVGVVIKTLQFAKIKINIRLFNETNKIKK